MKKLPFKRNKIEKKRDRHTLKLKDLGVITQRKGRQDLKSHKSR